jgi:hypothetical protein
MLSSKLLLQVACIAALPACTALALVACSSGARFAPTPVAVGANGTDRIALSTARGPSTPSGVIVVTPRSTLRRPVVIPSGASQTFLVSEQGGTFRFSCSSTVTIFCHRPWFKPHATSVTLEGHCAGLFGGFICWSWQVVVQDSLGNRAKIFARSSPP